jgi:two-component system response regulator
MLEIKRTEAEAIIDEAGQEQKRQRSLERAIWMLDRVISCVRRDRIDRRGRCERSVGDLLENARRELAAQLERGRAARVLESQNEVNDKTILLAQSNPDDRVFALRVFEKVGIKNRVVATCDGVEALNYLFGTGDYEGRDTRSMPELVLLDLTMPRLNGMDVLRHMRFSERTKSLPVLILVSSAEEQDTFDGHGPKPDGYIRKPLDFAKLSEAVRRLKLHWMVSDPSRTDRADEGHDLQNGRRNAKLRG